MFERIWKWYMQGLWTQEMVRQAYGKGVITEEQQERILADQGGLDDIN